MSENDIWTDSAPQYMKEGRLYSSVDHDHNGTPRKVSVAQNQRRKGEFHIVGSTAVYESSRVTPDEPPAEVVGYVMQLPYVDNVKTQGDSE